MKPVLRSLLFLSALAAAAKASPFLAVGDSAELFLTGTAAVRSQDNILLGSQGIDDLVTELSPGAELELGGKGRPGKGGLEYKARHLQYRDNSVLDHWDSSARAFASYTDEATKLRFEAAYARLSDNTFDLRPAGGVVSADSLLSRDTWSGLVSGDFTLGETHALVLSTQYDRLDPRTSTGVATDLRIVEIPVACYFRVAPGQQLGLGVSYRDTQVGPGAGVDSHDIYTFVGLRGQLSSSISGTVSAGYLHRSLAVGPGQASVGAHASLTYALSDATRLVAQGDNDFTTAPSGVSRRDLRGSLSFVSQLGNAWTLSLKGGYTRAKYLGTRQPIIALEDPTGRLRQLHADSWYEGGLSLSFALNSALSFTGGYGYRQLSSKDYVAEFTDQVFSFSIQLRY